MRPEWSSPQVRLKQRKKQNLTLEMGCSLPWRPQGVEQKQRNTGLLFGMPVCLQPNSITLVLS